MTINPEYARCDPNRDIPWKSVHHAVIATFLPSTMHLEPPLQMDDVRVYEMKRVIIQHCKKHPDHPFILFTESPALSMAAAAHERRKEKIRREGITGLRGRPRFAYIEEDDDTDEDEDEDEGDFRSGNNDYTSQGDRALDETVYTVHSEPLSPPAGDSEEDGRMNEASEDRRIVPPEVQRFLPSIGEVEGEYHLLLLVTPFNFI